MTRAAVRSEVVVLLLMIYCLMYFPSFVGVMCVYLFCYALLCVHSSFAIILAGCFAITVLQMYCYYKCSVALPLSLVIISHTSGCAMLRKYAKVYPSICGYK